MPYKDKGVKREYDRTRYQEHREEINARGQVYHQANRERDNARCRAYRLAHREERLAYDAAYLRAHREQRNAYYAARREANPEYYKAYQRANLEACRIRTQRRAARKRSLLATLTPLQWEAIKAAYRHRCAYCGKKLKQFTMDHVIPLNKGGPTTMGNIVPACSSCNSKKSTNLPVNPVKLVLA